MFGHVLFVISVSLASAAALIVAAAVVFALLVRRRAPADPRAAWRTQPAVPVWFEHAASGARFIPGERQGRLVVGAAGDCAVPGARPRHAQVRVFSRHAADIAPIDGAPLRVGSRRVRAPVPLQEGDRVRLGDVELVAHVGWVPDPDDPRVGSVVAGERLWERLSARRYAAERGVVELLDPPVDPVAYQARVRAAEALAPELLRVRTLFADAIVVDAVDGAPRSGPLAPEGLVEVCRLVAPLHAAGLGHGGLADAVFVAPGYLRLWPVAPVGDVPGDMQALRRLLPVDWPDVTASDARGLALAVLRHGTATRRAFDAWRLGPCARCGEPFARPGPPRTTMFDGRDPATGRAFGGRTTEHRSECLACGHVDVRTEHEAYS